MKLAFLHCGLQSQLAAQYLVEKHNFKEISIQQTLKKITSTHFGTDDDNFIKTFSAALSTIDKYALIKYISSELNNTTNVVISDVSTLNEYYSILIEGFVPVKFDTKEFNYEQSLTDIPMLTVSSESNLAQLQESVQVLLDNYQTLAQNRTKGGVIKFIDDQEEKADE